MNPFQGKNGKWATVSAFPLLNPEGVAAGSVCRPVNYSLFICYSLMGLQMTRPYWPSELYVVAYGSAGSLEVLNVSSKPFLP